MMQPLLIELGTEELPAKALPGLAQALFDGVVDGLTRRGIAIERGNAKPLYTPRRLAVLLPGVAPEQAEQQSEVFGPYLTSALDVQGAPTRALQGFAQKAGVDWTRLARVTDSKGERFVHRAVTLGAPTAALLPGILGEAVAAMPIPKPMRWGDHDYAFARPLHWLVLLLGAEVVEGELFGVKAGRNSRGHRFHHDKAVWIGHPGDYVDALRAAHVLVDADERKAIIHAKAQQAAQPHGFAYTPQALLDEVNCLVEWPAAVACRFDPAFLAVPREALIATMVQNQKFFPVLDAETGGGLTEHFVGIANIESADVAQVREGYERVIRPRFADAKFFFDEDLKQGLDSMNEGLKSVTYQARLGSIADKVARVAALAESIAPKLGVDPALARRAAELSKADLQSRLVNEFPELQGIAGRHYALRDAALNDLTDEARAQVAAALDEAYMPRFAGDAIAPSKLGQVLAIAERLDTLAGGFAAGLKPTGSKDPFALRRNALGLARTILESEIELDLVEALIKANDGLTRDVVSRTGACGDHGEIREFIQDRLRTYYLDRDVTGQQFDSVAALQSTSLLDFERRLQAIGEFATLPETAALAAAHKRIRNILKKSDASTPAVVDTGLLHEPAERELHAAIESAIVDTDPLLAQRDYTGVLTRLALLRPQVDAFFDSVMVNVEDAPLRANRLGLLKRLADRLGSVAAIEHLSI